MSSDKMSFTEPVPSGTWQSSVLISVKLLMFQVDVRFFLARICSYQCDIYLFMWAFWSQVASPTKFCSPTQNCGPFHVFSQPGGGGCLSLPLLQRISKQRSPQMKKGLRWISSFVSTHLVFTVLHVYVYLYLVCKYGLIYVHLSVWFV